jgi:hypothetical protein
MSLEPLLFQRGWYVLYVTEQQIHKPVPSQQLRQGKGSITSVVRKTIIVYDIEKRRKSLKNKIKNKKCLTKVRDERRQLFKGEGGIK